MGKKRRWLLPILTVATLAFCFSIFLQHRPVAYYAACKVGLPNVTRPEVLSLGDDGCAIFEKKRTYSGVVMIGSEGTTFHLETGEIAWFHCSKDGCGQNFEHQIASVSIASCPNIWRDGGMAHAEIEGWMASYPGRFGHLGAFSYQFYASRIVKVGPPPASYVRQIERKLREHGACI